MLVQLVWLRIAIQSFGTSAVTVATVLAIALVGLGWGSIWFGNRTRDDHSSLRTAGWLLLGGCCAVLGHLALHRFSPEVFSGSLNALPGSVSLLASTALVLLPLNFLLGGILPILVGTANQQRSSVGFLYGAETLGGAAGALLAGFWLIHDFGLAATLAFAGGVCFLAGLSAVLFPGRREEAIVDVREQAIGRTNSTWLTRLSVAIFLAGVASVGLEIVWQRLLILIVGTDTHSYTIVVVSYLLGVCLGAQACALVSRHDDDSDKPVTGRSFFWLQLGIAVLSLIVMLTFCGLASGVGQRWLSSGEFLGQSIVLKRFLLCTGLLILPTVLIGASFPVAVGLLKSQDVNRAAATGRVYGLVTFGNVIGVLLCGFFLIPLVGLQTSVVVLGWIAALAGCLAVASHARLVPWLTLLGLLVVGGFIITSQRPIGLADLPADHQLLFYREGPANTVSVFSTAVGPMASRKMAVDGIVIGESLGGVDEKQQMLAHLPFLLNASRESTDQSPLQVLTIGLGTGILAGQVAQHANVDHVTCVELSPAVIEASALFDDVNAAINTNPKVSVRQADGIFFLRKVNQQYDAVISDGKSRPGHAGNVAFFSQDYYLAAAGSLNVDGVFVQWFSLEASLNELQVVLNSFANAFEHTQIAIAAPDSIYLVGSPSPMPWSESAIGNYMTQHGASLADYGWRSADDFASMVWLDARDVVAGLPDGVPVNSFERPVLEQFSLDIHLFAGKENKVDNLAYLKTLVLDPKVESLTAKSTELRSAAANLIDASLEQTEAQQGWLERSGMVFENALTAWPRLNRGLSLSNNFFDAAESFSQQGDSQAAISAFCSAARLTKQDVTMQALCGQRLEKLGAASEAAGCFFKASKLQPNHADHHVGFALCLIKLNKHRAAERPLRTALQLDPDHAVAHWAIATVAAAAGDDRKAKQHFARAFELNPDLRRLSN